MLGEAHGNNWSPTSKMLSENGRVEITSIHSNIGEIRRIPSEPNEPTRVLTPPWITTLARFSEILFITTRISRLPSVASVF
jgi:hypothetical protein